MQYRAKPRRSGRRGLSTVIGAVFMVLVTIGALNVVLWTMQQQNRVTESIIEKTNANLARLNEDIDISEIRIDNDKFNMTISNSGGSVAEIASVYLVNETANEQYRYEVDMLIGGGSSIDDVGQALSFVVKDDTAYSIKVVTKTGNIATAGISPLSETPLQLDLYVIPPTVTTGENVTILFSVTNNNTSSENLVLVSPEITANIDCQAGPDCSLTQMVEAIGEVAVSPGSSALIKEVYEVVGPKDAVVTFNATFAGATAGNFVIEEASIIVVAASQTVQGDIAISPDIYLIVPGSFGASSSSSQQGLWGAVIVNPTDFSMNVSRVVMTMYTAEHSGSTEMLSDSSTSGCNDSSPTRKTAIVPSTASEWTCPHDNSIEWKDLSNPEQIQPGDVKSFLVKVQPGGLGGGEEPSAAVVATVFTDIGRFTKSGYTAGMSSAYSPLGNVYLTDTNDGPTALQNSHMFGHNNTIQAGLNQTFHIAVADLDTRTDTYINSGSKLIINVPADFKNVTAPASNSWFDTIVVQKRADGVTQVIGTTVGHTGDAAAGEAKIIQFWAVTSSPNEDTTYIMDVFHEGKTTGYCTSAMDSSGWCNEGAYTFSAGALAEIALQVDGGG